MQPRTCNLALTCTLLFFVEIKAQLKGKIEGAAGDIRAMKEAGTKDKETLQPKIDELLGLKTQYVQRTIRPRCIADVKIQRMDMITS